jgi:PAS domain S-box-containing protein
MLEERHFVGSFSPIREDSGAVGGVLQHLTETTARVRAERYRDEVEKALRASEERQRETAEYLNFTFEAFGAAEFDADLQTRAIRPSPRLNALYGYPPDAPITMADCAARYHPEDAETVRSVVDRAGERDERRFQLEFRIVLPNGTVRWVLSRGEVVCDERGHPVRVRGAAIEITDRKRMEETLRAGEERFRTLTSLVPALLWQSDPSGRSASLNSRWLEYTGQTLDETQNSDWLSAIHPDDAAAIQQAFADAHARQQPLERQHRLRRHDGAYRWFLIRQLPLRDAQGKVVNWFGAATDIHDQRMAMEALRRSEERQAFLLALNDALRPLDDPLEIQAEAAASLGRHLGVNRVAYGEVDEDGAFIAFERSYAAGMPELIGRFRMADFGAGLLGPLTEGRTIVVGHIASSADLSEPERVAYAGLGIAALVGVPLNKEQRFVASLVVHHARPRRWTESEVALIEETAERTWAAVERARTEAALREREEELRIITDNVPAMIGFHDREQRFASINSEYPRFHGIPREAILGRQLRDVVGEAAYARLRPYVERALAGKAVRFEDCEPNKHGPGRHNWTDETYIPRFGPDGTVQGYFVLAVDITERKRAEETYRTGAERLKLALAIGGLATWDWNITTGEVAWFDEHYRVHGEANREVTSTYANWIKRIHPDDRAAAEAALADARAARTEYVDSFRTLQPDGSTRWCSARGLFFYDERGEAVRMIGVMEDVTDRHLAENALRVSEERYRLATEAFQGGISEYDVRTGKTWASEAYFRLFGRDPAEGARPIEHIFDAVHPDDLAKVGEVLRDIIGGKAGVMDVQYRAWNREGRWGQFWTRAVASRDRDGVPLRVIATTVDVTARNEAIEELADSRERLATIFAHASVGLSEVSLEGRFQEVNAELCRVLGRSREELLDLGVPEVTHPDDIPRSFEAVGEALRTGKTTSLDKRYLRPDGTPVWSNSSITRLRRGEGKPDSLLVVTVDLTQRRAAEEAVRASETHTKLLLAELQHRVRNTLGLVRSIARRTAASSQTVQDFATKLEGRISAFARVQAAVTRDPSAGVKLSALVEDELHAHGAHLGEQITAINGPRVRLHVKAGEAMALAIHELATNAVKYGGLSTLTGRIAVEWWSEEEPSPTLIFTWTESGLNLAGWRPTRRGFGMELIERTLAYELGGETTLAFMPTGLHCRIVLPLSDEITVIASDPTGDAARRERPEFRSVISG